MQFGRRAAWVLKFTFAGSDPDKRAGARACGARLSLSERQWLLASTALVGLFTVAPDVQAQTSADANVLPVIAVQTSPPPAASASANVGSGPQGQPNMASQTTIVSETLNARPVSRPGELLEAVPGLIVTQHSGEGKANQYFLRGYNLDHGTDLAIYVDDVPINLRTHAHGQGYSDLNWLMP
jgi:outer membrane receptor for Fe3+-dicitrate